MAELYSEINVSNVLPKALSRLLTFINFMPKRRPLGLGREALCAEGVHRRVGEREATLYTTLCTPRVYHHPVYASYLHTLGIPTLPPPSRQRVYIPVLRPACRDRALGSTLRLI